MKTEVVTITPKVAESMLTRNYENNRNIRKTYVTQLAEVMKSGRFLSENGQTIVIGEDDGVLYDGQHRLHAIIQSGTTQPMLVVYVKDGERAYTTIDNGTKRQASDYIDGPYKNERAAAAKVMACVEWGQAPLLSCLQGKMYNIDHIDRGLIIAYESQHAEEIENAVVIGRRMREAVRCGSPTMYAVLILLVRYCGTDDFLDEFINEFSGNETTNPTINAIKMAITRKALTGKNLSHKVDAKWLLSTMLDAYTHFCAMDNSTMFNSQNARVAAYTKMIQQKREAKKGVE